MTPTAPTNKTWPGAGEIAKFQQFAAGFTLLLASESVWQVILF